MTIRELILAAGEYPLAILAYLIVLPLLAYLLGRFVQDRMNPGKPMAYAFMGLIYLAAVPGMFSGVLTAYLLLFRSGESLLDLNILVFLGPIASMGATLGLVNRRVSLEAVPGFDRLSGLMILLGVSFGIVFLLSRFWVVGVLHGSIGSLVTAAAVVFALLKAASQKLFR